MTESDRHSIPFSADIIADPDERAAREAKNGLLQFDLGIKSVDQWTHTDLQGKFRLRPSLILSLHRSALDGISLYAGNWRPAGVQIKGSKHEPPGAHQVPEMIEEMCDYVNENWNRTAFHLAAYLMWRLNWIHPFADGNGRTSRILSYVVLCIRLGYKVPGAPTIPEQIVADRRPYFSALDAADERAREGQIDVSAMEELLKGMLATQLMGVIRTAAGDA